MAITNCKEMERVDGKEVIFKCRALNGRVLKYDNFVSAVFPQRCSDCPAVQANAVPNDNTNDCFVYIGSDFDPYQFDNLRARITLPL